MGEKFQDSEFRILSTGNHVFKWSIIRGKNMHLIESIFLIGSIFFPLRGFLYSEINCTIQKLIFDNTDTNTLRVCVHIAYCVTEFKTVFRGLIF